MQDQLVDSYEYRIKQLEEANRRLREENQQVNGVFCHISRFLSPSIQLKISYELAVAERDVERDQMSKSVSFEFVVVVV